MVVLNHQKYVSGNPNENQIEKIKQSFSTLLNDCFIFA
jgi:hypothetical protein